MKKLLFIFFTIAAQYAVLAQWTSFPGTAQEIVCGSSTQVAVSAFASPNTIIYKRNFTTNTWTQMTGTGVYNNLGLGADGMLYGKSSSLLNSTSNLITFNAIPAVAYAFTPITGILYNNVSVQSQYYAIGCTGTGNNNIYHRYAPGSWQLLPGSTNFAGNKVVVGYDGAIYAMNWSAGNNVYAYTSGTWTAVSNGTITATDIAVGDAGKVMAIAGGLLYYRQNGNWVLDATAPNNLTRVSVATDGTIFLLTSSSSNNIRTNTWQNVVCGSGISSPVNTTPSQNLSICGGQATTLTATGNGVLNWSGPSAGSGTVISSPVLNSNATYSVTRTENGCVSAPTVINVTVTPIPTVSVSNTSAVNLSICSGNTTTLSVSGSGAFEWYDAATNGTLLATGNTFATNTLTTNTTFYVQNGSGICASARTPITVTVSSSVPAIPTSTMSAASLSVCSQSWNTLRVNGTGTINWYTVPSGGTAVATGTTYALNPFPATGVENYYTYYAESSNVCGSSLRTAITVTVKAGPTEAPTLISPADGKLLACTGQQFTVSATHPSLPINWSWVLGTIGTGTTATHSFGSAGTPQIWAEVTLNGCTLWTNISTTISATPTIPTITTNTSSLSVCPTNNTTLTATGTSSLSWFSSPTSTTAIGTGTLFATPTLTNTTPYYVATYQNGCYSSRAVQTVTVKVGPTEAPIITSPTNGKLLLCTDQQFTVTATHPTLPITWNSPTPIGTGTTLIDTYLFPGTPTIYAEVTLNGCTKFSAISVTVSPTPGAPVFSGTNSICSGNTSTIGINSPGSWYASATSTTALATGTNSFVTPTLTTTTSFYASIVSNGCEGYRAVKTITITPLPAQPVNLSSTIGLQNSGCQGYVAEFYVGTNCNWYTSATGGTSFLNSNTYSIPNLTTTTTYYVDRTVNGCTSAPRVALVATVIPIPSVLSQTIQNANCNGASNGSISLTLNNASNYTYNWTPNVSTTYSATNLAAQVYTVQIDNLGCIKTQTYNITQPAIYNVPVNVLANGTILGFGNSYTGSPSFQWVDCNNSNAPIAGATNATFTPTITGNYALTFGYSGCVSTSTCNVITVTTTDINENNLLNGITLQPNPASTFFTLNNVAEGTSVYVIDVTGKIVVSNSVIDSDKSMTIETSNLSNGIYIIQLKNNGAVAHKKLIVSK